MQMTCSKKRCKIVGKKSEDRAFDRQTLSDLSYHARGITRALVEICRAQKKTVLPPTYSYSVASALPETNVWPRPSQG
jgi:hypothetical protein